MDKDKGNVDKIKFECTACKSTYLEQVCAAKSMVEVIGISEDMAGNDELAFGSGGGVEETQILQFQCYHGHPVINSEGFCIDSQDELMEYLKNKQERKET